MKHFPGFIQRFVACLAVTFLAGLFVPVAALAWDPPDPRKYMPPAEEVLKTKALFDDPRAMYAGSLSLKNVVPKELYEKLVFPVDQMKKEWAEVVGFTAPDVVGKKAPEIKPGKYTYRDLDKYPGLKDLFWPSMLKRIKPGGPPFAGNIPEFEIVPTQQQYHSLPVSQATKANLSKIKTDSKGFLVPESWEGGYPYPRPSGPHKAVQIMYDWEKRYINWEQNSFGYAYAFGFKKDLSGDVFQIYTERSLRTRGRLAIEPYGFLDERAKLRGEQKSYMLDFLAPRDLAGMALSATYYHVDKPDLLMAYVPQMRRVRLMSSSDTQDTVAGNDLIYDDNDGFSQKLNTGRFPYEWKVLEETEYLAIFPDCTEYYTKKGLELRGVKFMRRPVYVIEGKQSDPNYVYGKRIFYIDRETFMVYEVLNFDQKGRLYRTYSSFRRFEPDMGVFHSGGMLLIAQDHIDLHSNFFTGYVVPAVWSRKNMSLEQNLGSK